MKSADSKWRPEAQRSPVGSPRQQQQMLLGSPGRSPHHSPSLSGSQSARSLGASPQSRAALSPSVHDINHLTGQGRGLYGGNYAQAGQYAPQQLRGPVGPYSVEAQQMMQQRGGQMMPPFQLSGASPPQSARTPGRSPQRQASQPSLHSSQQQQLQPASGYPFEPLHASHSPSFSASSSSHHQYQQPHSARGSTAAYHPSPIFDKLTDARQYTGASRARFDAESGRGLGLAGRVDLPPERYQGDAHASPVINDLSQITRQQFNIGSPQGKTHKFHY
jgi:hypothetical protein